MDWIRVTHALPIVQAGGYPTVPNHYSASVLVWVPQPTNPPRFGRTCLGTYCWPRQGFETVLGGTFAQPVTHWMPLPEGPDDGSPLDPR